MALRNLRVVWPCLLMIWIQGMGLGVRAAEAFALRLRDVPQNVGGGDGTAYRYRSEEWLAEKTAIIVCDAWDLHHSINAVRRLEEMAPRLNDVLKEARRRGATILHAPSDCMESYAAHPARLRAINVLEKTGAVNVPEDVADWCLKIPAEDVGIYPIDQSDGGEDDDPKEHAEWVERLKALGRNPGMPWKSQTELLTIDSERDYISSLGDEVWAILESRGIERVILTGVHLNMCVLGRPFGLRRMVASGREVVLMRDMTDTMYNPARWPYVDHFTGTDLMVEYVERHVCPTITSDQVLGGKPFKFSGDTRMMRLHELPSRTVAQRADERDPTRHWVRVQVPFEADAVELESVENKGVPVWIRCVVQVPKEWMDGPVRLVSSAKKEAGQEVSVWWNGVKLEARESRSVAEGREWFIPSDRTEVGSGNLLVVRSESLQTLRRMFGGGLAADSTQSQGFVIRAQESVLHLYGSWQIRVGEGEYSSIPLPAQFGGAPDVVFQP